MPTKINYTLKTAPIIEGAVFNPIEYKPISRDVSILERSIARRKEMEDDYYKQNEALNNTMASIRAQLHFDKETNEWFDKEKDNISKRISDIASTGDYNLAKNTAIRLGSELVNNKDTIGRIKSNKDYETIKSNVQSMQEKGEITPVTYDYWLDKNPYEYKTNDRGELIPSQYKTPVKSLNMASVAATAVQLIKPNRRDITEQSFNDNGVSTPINDTNYGSVKASDNKLVSQYSIEKITKREIEGVIEQLLNEADLKAQVEQQYEVDKYELNKIKEQLNAIDANNSPEYSKLMKQKQLLESMLGNSNDYNTYLTNKIYNTIYPTSLSYTHQVESQYVQQRSATDSDTSGNGTYGGLYNPLFSGNDSETAPQIRLNFANNGVITTPTTAISIMNQYGK